ncbi:IS66 family transposase [Halosquirtibacter laminarini]|uniref:IS66 family transposase n=1 Tax=Halosquirtibacter laminarini TaxID=3374600 RepID=A0AC61NDC1_9BACT|nr:IS66 family transposase [Prolixibacteraceae bacterium]
MNKSDIIEDVSKEDLLDQLQKMMTEYSNVDSENTNLKQENESLKAQIAYLQRRIFGSTKETYKDPNQLELDLGVEDENLEDLQISSPEEEVIEVVKKKKKAKRKSIPSDLPRQVEVIEPDDVPEGATRIGEEISERIEFSPGKLYVRQIVRPKYRLPEEDSIIISELPSDLIPKCMAGNSLISQFIVGKFYDHIPLYRAQGIFKRSGIDFPKATINGWIRKAAELRSPLYKHIEKKVIQSDYIQADETSIKVLTDKKQGATHLGYFWIYYAPHIKSCLFTYDNSRRSSVPESTLKKFKGVLQTDGYQGYHKLGNQKEIIKLACMAHARRKFFEAKENDRTRAEYALKKIQELYKIERTSQEKELSIEETYLLRQELAVPILKELEKWLKKESLTALPKSPIGKAINYSLNLWDELCQYTEDGSYIIDNNNVENKVRPVAIGRKNYLFAGSEEGAKRAAMFYTLSSMCKMADVEPHAWYTDILNRISDTKPSKYDDLLPLNWK